MCILKMWDNCLDNQVDGCMLRTIQLIYKIGKLVILRCHKDAIYYIELQAPIKDIVRSIDSIIESHLAAENFKCNISLNSLYKHRSALHQCF